MGKKVIPEQVEYFCDICAVKLSKDHHDDFVINTKEVCRDFSGSACADHKDSYELCDLCVKKFKDWLKDMQK